MKLLKLHPGFALALGTITLWSFSAFIISSLNRLPTLYSLGIAMSIGGLVGAARWREWRVTLKTFAVGLLGMFVYHILLFNAFQLAPAVEVSMLNYLWPLLIVLLSPVLLKGYTLRVQHIAGALIGFCGAALIFTGGKVSLEFTALGGGMNPRFWGFLLAAGAALSWAVYSLLTKRLPPFSSFAVGGFCLFSGLLSLGLYFVSTIPYGIPLPTVQPSEWLLLILLGIGPNGIAFFTWDAAVKRGDPRQIGSLTYLTPLLSTFNLVVLGRQPFSILTLAALILIIAGAVISSIEPERKT